MGIRMTGLISNLDTDSIVEELMKAQSTKKTKIENKITKTEWTQEKWKELNTKIYALYTGSISKMKLQGSYSTKKVTSSDESKVTVSASTSAVLGTHSVQVDKLASSQYVTGSAIGNITDDDGNSIAVTKATKLSAIDSSLAPTADSETTINFSTANKTVSLSVNENTTIDDFITAAQDAGLNASFDANQKRFFISSSESGAENYFEITTSTVTGDELTKKNALRDTVDYDSMTSTDRASFDKAADAYRSITKSLEDTTLTETARTALETQLKEAKDTLTSYAENKVTKTLKSNYEDGAASDAASYGVKTYEETVADATESYYNSLRDGATADSAKLEKAIKSAVTANAAKYAEAVKKEYTSSAPGTNPYTEAANATTNALASYSQTTIAGADNTASGDKLTGLGISTITANVTDGKVTGYNYSGGMTVVAASDSKIKYNGAEIESASNSVTVNGLTFELHGVTSGTSISLAVGKDTSAIYDSIKQFVTDYNEVLKEMNTLYNADSAREYDPLTDEEKEAMSDDQIEKWETKIKDSLLRRDTTLSSLISAMKNSLQKSVTYEGKSYSLSTFGIGTTDYTEKGLLHIDGDPDDSSTSSNNDKLKAALESDPEAVMTTLSTLVGNLYSDLTDKMKSTTLSSALTFYNDKQLSKTLTQYKSDLSDMEDRLQTLEDRYYDQFTAMETALAKLNSQQSSLSSFIGS